MKQSVLETLTNFTTDSLPDLDVVTLGALQMLSLVDLPKLQVQFKRPLVIGSGNAAVTGRILFTNYDAVFADESSYKEVMSKVKGIDGVVLISASGAKHAIAIAKYFYERKIDAVLITNNEMAPAREYFSTEKIIIFPKNREPYTYNTSTYLGMILAVTGESAIMIEDFILNKVQPKLLRNFGSHNAFTIILPSEFHELREMFRTKFDELFGSFVIGRIFTVEEIKHAKTIIPSGDELFISLGVKNEYFGLTKNRLDILLPETSDYAMLMAVGYYIIGQIQKSHPAYFKENIATYVNKASDIFDQNLSVIVE